MNTERTINGFSLFEITNIIESITESPKRSKSKMMAVYNWKSDGANSGLTKDSFVVDIDNYSSSHPSLVLNGNEWVSPMKTLLESLSKSITITLLLHAAARGIKISFLTLSVDAVTDIRGFMGLDDTITSGFQEIRVDLTIGSSATESQVDQLKRCLKRAPVYQMLVNKTDIGESLKISFEY